MGRRKSKKIIKRPKKTIPKVFQCPVCGEKSVVVDMRKDEGVAFVSCGSCGRREAVPISKLSEPVDAYSAFVDICSQSQGT
ncbi:MAG: transcription elongation factor 1 family protein [Candidatus Jordarchaeales archaeon]